MTREHSAPAIITDVQGASADSECGQVPQDVMNPMQLPVAMGRVAMCPTPAIDSLPARCLASLAIAWVFPASSFLYPDSGRPAVGPDDPQRMVDGRRETAGSG